MSRKFQTKLDLLKKRFEKVDVQAAFYGVLLFGLIERGVMWMIYGPATYNDSLTYWRLANLIQKSWSSYDGTRVPVYPFFLTLVGSDDLAYIIQLLMGLLITLGFFYIGYRITSKAWFAAAVGMLHQLNFGQVLFEANILTETMATFWMMAALVCLVHGMYADRGLRSVLALGMGLASGLAILTRPIFIVLPPLLGVWMVLTWHLEPWPAWQPYMLGENTRLRLRHILNAVRTQAVPSIAFVAPVIGLVFGWASYIHMRYGDWALSTMTGYHLIQHTGAFFEYVPDKHAALRDVYIEYRDARIAQYGTQANTIWEAIPPMMEASGHSFYDLSRTLARISVDLIREHPGLYLRSVGNGWVIFWKAPVYWTPDALKLPFLQDGIALSLIQGLIFVQRIILVSVNFVFVITPIGMYFMRRYYRQVNMRFNPRPGWIWLILLGLVWSASIVQAILDHGDNPRFLIPLQTIPVMWTLWLLSFGKVREAAGFWIVSVRRKIQGV